MAREHKTFRDRIVQDPKIMVGKPLVKGTRIPVEKVIHQLAYKPDLQELFAIYPELTMEDVKACLAYARAAIVARRQRPSRQAPGNAAAL